MINKEAIEILKSNKPTSDPRKYGKDLCAADKAIEVLEKQERKEGGEDRICNKYSSNSSGE